MEYFQGCSNSMDPENAHDIIIDFIRTEIKKRRSKGIVIGISGGIDSAVLAVLATEALGNEHVFGLILPDEGITPMADITDAINLCNNLHIHYRKIPINDPKSSILGLLDRTDNKIIQGNLVARIRMSILYYYAALLERLVLGTSNKTEIGLGYFTKFGDGGADLLPLGDLYKTQVFALARYLCVPEAIVNKRSSARLWPGQLTEIELGLSFEMLDKILEQMNSLSQHGASVNGGGLDFNQTVFQELCGKFPNIDPDLITRIFNLSTLNRHKSLLPYICNLS